jgi:hypothetical protein
LIQAEIAIGQMRLKPFPDGPHEFMVCISSNLRIIRAIPAALPYILRSSFK